VRLRKIDELCRRDAISERRWPSGAATRDIPVAVHDDLIWADAYAFWAPTRFGSVASQLEQFIDTTGGARAHGLLADKPVTPFTSAINRHGGNESALYHSMYHWGAVLEPPGCTGPAVSAAFGNPNGSAQPPMPGHPTDNLLAAARFQGRRLATTARHLLVGRAVA
jgi:NAD(P)H dehydrogenase (quinone)